ncbi:hypothetical protein ASD35_02665 [Pelomonas sp. Root1444]|nr:hypothetical protein ASD35_02665 [Pelomonas sp. Root1444]
MKLLAPIGFTQSPSVATLHAWSVWEVVDDDNSVVRLVVGWIKPTRLRITSPIDRFEGGEVVTRSGSVYRLVGTCASPEELEDQKARRNVLLGGRDAVDVTATYAGAR